MEDNILKVLGLPKLSESEISNVVGILQGLGVETWVDLNHLEPSHFTVTLK